MFVNETYTLTNVVTFCSAIHGIDYSNTDGVLNEVNLKTKILSASSAIQQEIIVAEKGKLNYISATTILFGAGFYAPPNVYDTLGYTI